MKTMLSLTALWDAYLVHRAREKAEQLVLPNVESVLIFDYEA